MTGFEMIQNIPLPVGEYGIAPDDFYYFNDMPGSAVNDLPANAPQTMDMAQKLRVDLGGKWRNGIDRGLSAVRVLEKGPNAVAPMITSMAVVRSGYGAANRDGNQAMMTFVRELFSEAGIYAIPAHDQHHAIILLKDVRTGSERPMTPQHLATLIDEGRLESIIERYGMREWAADYAAHANLFSA